MTNHSFAASTPSSISHAVHIVQSLLLMHIIAHQMQIYQQENRSHK